MPTNQYVTTASQSLATANSSGLIRGFCYEDPITTSRRVASKLYDGTATKPFTGGYGISELANGTSRIAGTAATITGFLVLNQSSAFLTDPSSQIPQGFSGMGAAIYRVGSGARIALAVDPALGDISGNPVDTLYGWNARYQWIEAYSGSLAPLRVIGYSAVNNKSFSVDLNTNTISTQWTNTPLALVQI